MSSALSLGRRQESTWGFRVIVAGSAVASIGTAVTAIALVLDAAVIGSAVIVAAVFLAQYLPPMLLSIRVGKLVDRANPKTIWILALVCEAGALLIAAAVPILLVRVGLLAIAAVMSVASASAWFVLIPSVAGLDRTERANGIVTMASSLAGAIGPGIGAVLHEVWGTEWVLVLDGATSLILAAVVWRIVSVRHLASVDTARVDSEDSGRSARIFTADSLLRPLMLIAAGVMFGTSLEGVASVFYLREVAEGDDIVYGATLSAWAFGAIAGALVAAAKYPALTHAMRLVLGGVVMACGIVVSAAIPVVAVIFTVYLLGGLGNGYFNTALRNVIHARVSSARHGQAWATFTALSQMCIISGYLLGTPFAADHGRVVVLAAGIVPLIVAVASIASLRRHLRSSDQSER